MSRDVPPDAASWPKVRLSDVAELCLGKMLDKAKNKGRHLPYLRNPNVRWMSIDTSSLATMPFEEHEDERYSLERGDVLVCEGGEAGRAAVWDGRLEGVKFQKAIHRVRPGDMLDSRFLVYRLMADYSSGRLADYYTGATIKHLTRQDLARYTFGLPPLDEQRRIAAILDQADALRAKCREALLVCNNITVSAGLDLLGDAIKNEKGWAVRALADCTEEIKTGPFGSLLHEEDYVEGGLPLVNPKHIVDGRIRSDSTETVTVATAARLKQYTLRSGDVVMGRRGEMGRCAIVGPAQDGFLCGTGSLIIRPRPSLATALYLRTILGSRSMRERLERLALGATLPNLNTAIVSTLLIPLPPMEVQLRLEAVLAQADRLCSLYERSLDHLDRLFASLQHRAFAGRL